MKRIHKQFLFLYSVISITLLIFLLWIFREYDKGFGWSIDSLPVQLPMFAYLRDYVRNLFWGVDAESARHILYDSRIGLGGDALTFLSMWYLEPLSFTGVFFDNIHIEKAYDVLVLVRLYLIGLSFGIMCLYEHKENVYAITVGSLVYAFSGWTFFYIRHPVFYAGLIYLPILLISAKDTLKGKRGIPFIIIVALSAWTSYYYLYINTIILAFYCLSETFLDNENNDNRKRFLLLMRVAWRYILGVCMSMAVFLPNVLTFLNSDRTIKHLETGSMWRYETGWFHRVLAGLITTYYSAGHWLHNGFLPIGVLSLVLVCAFVRNKRFIIWSLLVAVGMAVPFFTYVFSGFSSIQFRWNYVIGLICAYAVVIFWNDRGQIGIKPVYYSIILIVFLMLPILYDDVNNKFYMEATLFLVLYLIPVTLYSLFHRKVDVLFFVIMLAFVVCNVVFDIRYNFMPEYGNYISEFVDSGESIACITDEPRKVSDKIDDMSFYRIDSPRLKVDNESSYVFLDYNGVSAYHNVLDGHVADFYHGLENVNTRLLDTIDHDSRTVLNEITSVKYFLAYKEDAAYVPYGYALYDSDGDVDIYRNEYALPIGYGYSEIIPESAYEQLTSLDKQSVIMKAAVVDEELPLEEYSASSSRIIQSDISYSFHGCEYDEQTHICKVTEPGGYLTVHYNNKEDSETYLRLSHLNIDDYYDVYWKIRVYNDSVDKIVELRSSSATYSYGNYDYMINLGYDSPEDTVNIAFPFICEFPVDEIEILHYPMADYPADATALRNKGLKNAVFENGYLEGDYTAEENELCVLSVPYSSGWTAYVDGKKQDIIRANIAFMGLLMTKGTHHIELRYVTPGLKTGIIVSLFAWLIFIIYLILSRKSEPPVESSTQS